MTTRPYDDSSSSSADSNASNDSPVESARTYLGGDDADATSAAAGGMWAERESSVPRTASGRPRRNSIAKSPASTRLKKTATSPPTVKTVKKKTKKAGAEKTAATVKKKNVVEKRMIVEEAQTLQERESADQQGGNAEPPAPAPAPAPAAPSEAKRRGAEQSKLMMSEYFKGVKFDEKQRAKFVEAARLYAGGHTFASSSFLNTHELGHAARRAGIVSRRHKWASPDTNDPTVSKYPHTAFIKPLSLDDSLPYAFATHLPYDDSGNGASAFTHFTRLPNGSKETVEMLVFPAYTAPTTTSGTPSPGMGMRKMPVNISIRLHTDDPKDSTPDAVDSSTIYPDASPPTEGFQQAEVLLPGGSGVARAIVGASTAASASRVANYAFANAIKSLKGKRAAMLKKCTPFMPEAFSPIPFVPWKKLDSSKQADGSWEMKKLSLFH